MSDQETTGRRLAAGIYNRTLQADVLVIGGSIAGAWAALAAQAAGASVVLAEKGWVGTAGVVAANGGGGHYILPGDPKQRAGALGARYPETEGLANIPFLEEVLQESYRCFTRLAEWGYGNGPISSNQNANSMAFLRKKLLERKVRILDHSPALELLLTDDGAVAGAAGVSRKTDETWAVRAGAVILATGGNAFLSGAMGTNGVTGDGYLIAAEVGVDFTGMEFSGHYGLSPLHGNSTKGGMFFQGHIFDEHGKRLDPLPSWFAVPNVAKALVEGRRVYTVLDKAKPENWDNTIRNVPNFYQYFVRQDKNPFDSLWPTGLTYEGTVRASGGLAVGVGCTTSVPGLFAAGDVTDRTKLTGAFLSGAGPAIAWCVASGEWSGRNAADFSLDLGAAKHDRRVRPTGGTGIRPQGRSKLEAREVIKAVQDEILPLEKNYFRNGPTIQASLGALNKAWSDAREDLSGGNAREVLKAREAAALVASSRWIYSAALERKETRGLHRRSDFPERDESQRHNLRVGGLDRVSVSVVDVPLTLPPAE